MPTYNRTYKLGISGYSPPNFPNSTTDEATTYWQEINTYSQVYGVHVEWRDTQILELVSAMYKHDISLVLGYQDSKEWGVEREAFLTKALGLIENNPKIKYFAIGNEVNVLYNQDPESFEKFIDDYKYFYSKIKEKYPELKVYTTFNYESLIGEGYLFGDVSHVSKVEVLDKFKGSIDLIGITTYPYFDYKTPADIPIDYLADLTSHLEVPIAITETGWMARTDYGPKYSEIDTLGLSGSEQEQIEYLDWLLAKTDSLDFEFMNWIFLNDPYLWENGKDPEQYIVFDSIALKQHDGSEKQVWEVWKHSFK